MPPDERAYRQQANQKQANQKRAGRMIIGIGSDLCNIDRIAAALARHGDRFEARVFTATERARANSRPLTRAGTLAKRFAAKEAFSKAVGTGFKRGVYMRDIGVVNAASGAPTLALSGGALAAAERLTPPGHALHIHLTITDDHPWAQAFVVLEARAEAASQSPACQSSESPAA